MGFISRENMKYKLVAGIVLICIAVIFIVQNTAVVDIKLFFWTVSMSRILLMLIILIIGIIAGFFLNSYIMHLKNK